MRESVTTQGARAARCRSVVHVLDFFICFISRCPIQAMRIASCDMKSTVSYMSPSRKTTAGTAAY